MSVRYLYRQLPVSQRICSYYRCQKPILRNIAKDKNGALYHYGCLNSALDEKHRCLNCFMIFDATEATFTDLGTDSLVMACPSCGSTNITNARGG